MFGMPSPAGFSSDSKAAPGGGGGGGAVELRPMSARVATASGGGAADGEATPSAASRYTTPAAAMQAEPPQAGSGDADGTHFAYLPPIAKPLGGAVVQFLDIHKEYKLEGGEMVQALKGVNLSSDSAFYPIRRGEFVMIRGPSGGGKTTMLNLIGTIDIPTQGNLELFGESVHSNTPDSTLAALRLAKIGFVFQTFNLLATLSAFENVELPMTMLGKLSKKQRRARTMRLLQDVGLEDRMSHLPSELSGGEQQRVTIARAMANEPELLLLDEPTGDLDSKNTVEVMDLLLSINQTKGVTCVMVTHNPALECYADRVLYVSDGAFASQAINTKQCKLNYDAYVAYLNAGH